MSLVIGVLFPYVRAYAAHAGVAVSDDELRADLARRAAHMPWWAALAAAAGALTLRWLMPLLVLGRPRLFEDLYDREADLVLARAQFTGFLPLKGMFACLKSLAVPVCYGREESLARIGYRK